MILRFDKEKRCWPSCENILGKHDVVFRAPVCDPTYGLPIGDGDTGCLLWLTSEKLHIQVNKTDLWDDSTADEGIYCPMEDENLNTCRYGAEIEVDFGCPLFEEIYSQNFEGRLSLSDASANIKTETPFCSADIRAFASHDARVTVLEAAANYREEMPISVTLKRWGSRTFSFWYNRFKGQAEKGLGGTESFASGRDVYITQRLRGTCFCVMLRALHEEENKRTVGGHTVKGEIGSAAEHKLTWLLTVAVGDAVESAVELASAQLDEAEQKGVQTLYEEHRREWADFWSKSFIVLPEKQDYLENLWYLNLYYANSEMRGAYPAHFCNGIWGFNHDFVPWNNFFHYNMQHALWPLNAARHPELANTYHRFRRKQLDKAKEYTRALYGKNGAMYADVCDRHGNMDKNVPANLTPLSQIAWQMYRQYRYTGDTEFLNDTVMPMLKAAGEFYLELLTMEDDGFYHIHQSQGYEGSPMFDDSITDLSMIRALFPVLAKELPEAEGEIYRKRFEKLPPYTVMPLYEEETDDEGRFLWGVGKGNLARGENVLSVGKKCENGEWLRNTFGNIEHDWYGFPDTEMATVFPAGILGLGDRGSELYDLVYNSICLHHDVDVPRNIPYADGTMYGGRYCCMGWCMEPIYLARMGMARELAEYIDKTVSAWIVCPQGFGMDSPHEVFWASNNLRWHKNRVRNADTGEMSVAPAWTFRHFDYETLPILATASNEMLLQSHDGTIRLFPAVSADASLSFRLAAEGGFIVNSVLDNGLYDIWIESVRGESLSFALPEFCSVPRLQSENGEVIPFSRENDVYTVSLGAGEMLHITPISGELPDYEIDVYRNNNVKKLGQSHLGEERYF